MVELKGVESLKTVCKQDFCNGCGACIQRCNKNAIKLKDSFESLNAIICDDLCINCGACVKVCPVNKKVEFKKSINWYQGWANDEQIRKNSASGGFATEIAAYFIKAGGVVCTCVFENGNFVYTMIDDLEKLKSIAGSKYVKSKTGNAYKDVKISLQDGKKVLFIGLPCHVAGLLNFVGDLLNERLFTIDLICHGTPSVKLLEKRLQECHYELKQIKDMRFRVKYDFRLCDGSKALCDPRVLDSYMFTFLRGMSYTRNCYECLYAGKYRISDITIGDSWGSELSEVEKKKGISLALCQTEKGKKLLKEADLELLPVDIETAIKNNNQLNHPMQVTGKRAKFFKYISQNKSYTIAAYRADKIVGLRQLVKTILIKLKIFGEGGGQLNQYVITIRKE